MAIFDELKSIAGTLREADKIPQYEQILGIQQKLLEMQNKIFELEEKNRKLNETLNLKKNLLHKGEVYYLNENNKEDGPFCALCCDSKDKLIRMTHWNETCKKCPNCEKVYSII